MNTINILDKFATFDETWSPKIVANLNGQFVKLVKFEGEFVWHHHDVEDEMFLVIKGEMQMQFRNRTETVGEGEFIVVPRGVEHCPKSNGECWVMLFEPDSTLNTGNIENERTRKELETI